jgi:hypothetical protein
MAFELQGFRRQTNETAAAYQQFLAPAAGKAANQIHLISQTDHIRRDFSSPPEPSFTVVDYVYLEMSVDQLMDR